MKIGARVMVGSKRTGILALDNGDGTWNVELDDGGEGDFFDTDMQLCEDQSLDSYFGGEGKKRGN